MIKPLSYWNEISSYLGVSDKTAQRYAKKGMPVKYDSCGHPYITKQEVDKWRFGKRKVKI